MSTVRTMPETTTMSTPRSNSQYWKGMRVRVRVRTLNLTLTLIRALP